MLTRSARVFMERYRMVDPQGVRPTFTTGALHSHRRPAPVNVEATGQDLVAKRTITQPEGERHAFEQG